MSDKKIQTVLWYGDGVHLDARNHMFLGNYLCDFLHNERFSGG